MIEKMTLKLVRFDHIRRFGGASQTGASLPMHRATKILNRGGESQQGIPTSGVFGRYFASAVTFDNASACACPQRKVPGWKRPMADAIRSKAVVR